MITLNILPAALIKELKARDNYRLLFKIVITLLILLIFCCSIMTAAMFILWSHYGTTVSRSSVQSKDTIDYNNKVLLINKQLSDIKNIQENFVSWSDLINILSELVNDNVTFTRIRFDKISGQLSVAGRANTRESLLEFKDALETSEYFSEINLPTKNLFTKFDINFEISSTIDQYGIK